MATKESLIGHSLKNKHVLETPVENCLYKPFQLVDINTTLSKSFSYFRLGSLLSGFSKSLGKQRGPLFENKHLISQH